MAKYPFGEIERKWQATGRPTRPSARPRIPPFPREKRRYILDMFPYPSGAGLHVGHPEGYTATDIYCRYLRMNGLSTSSIPWASTPSACPPRTTPYRPAPTRRLDEANIDDSGTQIKSLGFSYDWDREISTCEPDYYRWTQWIFLKLFEKGSPTRPTCPSTGVPRASPGSPTRR